MALPGNNPIDAGWFEKGLPLDHLGEKEILCPKCKTNKVADVYKAILGVYGGFGSPFFISPFLKNKSTGGKYGTRSTWAQCKACTSLIPLDENAQTFCEEYGQPLGFGVDPEDYLATSVQPPAQPPSQPSKVKVGKAGNGSGVSVTSFCEHCGEPLLNPSQKFCENCGKPTAYPASLAEATARQKVSIAPSSYMQPTTTASLAEFYEHCKVVAMQELLAQHPVSHIGEELWEAAQEALLAAPFFNPGYSWREAKLITGKDSWDEAFVRAARPWIMSIVGTAQGKSEIQRTAAILAANSVRASQTNTVRALRSRLGFRYPKELSGCEIRDFDWPSLIRGL